MRGARRFFSREKQIFLVGFSLTIPRFLRKSKNRLNTSLPSYRNQSTDLLRKSIDWFLYEGNTDTLWGNSKQKKSNQSNDNRELVLFKPFESFPIFTDMFDNEDVKV